MEKTTRHFKFDYENDTTIEYVKTGLYSALNCSYTSEDPDYGTDTLHFTAEPAVSMAQMAYEMCGQLTRYLNKMDSGNYRDVTEEERRVFGDYSNSTLYAIEKALHAIGEEYRATKWFGCLEDVCREVAKRIIKDGNKVFSFCETSEFDWDNYSAEEYEGIASEWFGIKRIDPVFDNDKNEYIVAIGYWGGGIVKTAYVETDWRCVEENINDLARQMCNAIEKITECGPQSIVYATEDKEDK